MKPKYAYVPISITRLANLTGKFYAFGGGMRECKKEHEKLYAAQNPQLVFFRRIDLNKLRGK